MVLIKAVRIRGFRSISDQFIENLENHTVIVGKNSSGKSNLLRALSLFFTGEPAIGVPLNFARDHHYRPTRRQKKEISIEVFFNLPDAFNLRKELAGIKKLGNNFSIKKTWSLNRLREPALETEIYKDNGELVKNSEDLARDFLSLIIFRYIPNRTIPAQVLREESQQVVSAIFRKIKDTTQAASVLKGLNESAEQLLLPTAEALKESGASISNPGVATAESLGQMLQMSGFQATGLNGAVVRDEDWGSGHQSFFLLHVLKAIDTDYRRKFGWRQACIWAVEEPESGLHHDLQTRLARQLSEWSSDPSMRMQIFTTTHSPIMTMAGDSGCLVELGDTHSIINRSDIPSLVREAEERGVSSYLHPVLSFPFNTVVLVEGYIDERVLNHVSGLLGYHHIRFLSTLAIDPDEDGSGCDYQVTYVKKNSHFIGKRLPEAPFAVLVDWDVDKTKLNRLKSAYGKNSEKFVLQASAAMANPQLGDSFRGIERFYPSQIIREAHDSDDIAVAFPSKDGEQWSVAGEKLKKAKKLLMNRVLSKSTSADLGYLPELVKSIVETFKVKL